MSSQVYMMKSNLPDIFPKIQVVYLKFKSDDLPLFLCNFHKTMNHIWFGLKFSPIIFIVLFNGTFCVCTLQKYLIVILFRH